MTYAHRYNRDAVQKGIERSRKAISNLKRYSFNEGTAYSGTHRDFNFETYTENDSGKVVCVTLKWPSGRIETFARDKIAADDIAADLAASIERIDFEDLTETTA